MENNENYLDYSGLTLYNELIHNDVQSGLSNVIEEVNEILDNIEGVAYLDESPYSSVTPSFDPQADTIWKKPQILSDAEKAQVKANLGITDSYSALTSAVTEIVEEQTSALTSTIDDIENDIDLINGEGTRRTIGYSEASNIFSEAGRIYKVYDTINLGGNTLTMPSGCTLDFQGGKFINGTIVGDDTVVLSELNESPFSGITRTGTWESGVYVDKPYSGGTYNGMGRIVLGKKYSGNPNYDKQPVLYQADFIEENTVYEVRYDFTLGEDITIPNNCVLEFDGGSISGAYTLTGTHTCINAELTKIFGIDLSLAGTYKGSGYPEWFGCYPNDNSSVCASLAINALYSGFSIVELQIGTYTSKNAVSINVSSALVGKSIDSKILFSNVENDFIGIIWGNPGGDADHRHWMKKLENIRIDLASNNCVRTACLEIGATTRSYISDVYVRNENVKSSEFTAEEFADPAYYCNYGIVVNGSSELLTIVHWIAQADIPIYNKSFCDLVSWISGYCQSTTYGLSSIYGYSIGSNSRMCDTDFALGLFGVYCIGNGSDGEIGSIYENIRIEQLRAAKIGSDTNNNSGASFNFLYNNTVTGIEVKNCVLATNRNAFNILGVGSADIRIYNCSATRTTDVDYAISISGDNHTISSKGTSFVGPIKVPSSYICSGYNGPRPFGGNNYEHYPNIGDLSIVPNTSALTYQRGIDIEQGMIKLYKKTLRPASTSSAEVYQLITDWMYKNINQVILLFELYNTTAYAKLKVKAVMEYSNGVPTGHFTSLEKISSEGDDSFISLNTSNTADKYNIYLGASPNSNNLIYIRNRATELNERISVFLYSNTIIQAD